MSRKYFNVLVLAPAISPIDTSISTHDPSLLRENRKTRDRSRCSAWKRRAITSTMLSLRRKSSFEIYSWYSTRIDKAIIRVRRSDQRPSAANIFAVMQITSALFLEPFEFHLASARILAEDAHVNGM